MSFYAVISEKSQDFQSPEQINAKAKKSPAAIFLMQIK